MSELEQLIYDLGEITVEIDMFDLKLNGATDNFRKIVEKRNKIMQKIKTLKKTD